MNHELALFASITMALLTAFVGGYIARKLKLPTLVGYLLAGMAIGPFTPGFVGDIGGIRQLAEMGIIFMMFGVGLHFSLKDLWDVRRIAIPGALGQMLVAALVGLLLTQVWGWSFSAGLVLGLAISVASTVVLLRGLEDNGLLSSAEGKIAIGWLILQDLATVAILVLMPAIFTDSANPLESAVIAIVKTGVFVAIMLFAGTRFIPWLFVQIAHTRSRELFILAVVAFALGTAFAAAELFGVSLALGAFLAGVIVSESDVGHQVGAEVLPFREVFAVLFFVSVGMLVNPAEMIANARQVLELTLLIIVGKMVITVALGFVLPASGRTMLIVGAGSSQIGEFSFIVGQAGIALGVLTEDQYGLILAGALLSIVINPLMYRVVPALERALRGVPALWRRLDDGTPVPEPLTHTLADHVVIVGYGRVGMHIRRVLERLRLPYLIVEIDVERAQECQMHGIPTLFGDASNSELLTHVGLERARALVVTVPDQVTAELIVVAARDIAPTLPIIARAATVEGIERLTAHGAQSVIHPELEGGLELVRHTLLTLAYPLGQIQQYIDTVRRDAYDTEISTPQEQSMLDQLVTAVRGMDIGWRTLSATSPLVGKTLAEADMRAQIGASVIAVIKSGELFANPKANTRIEAGDVIGLIGNSHELAAAAELMDAHA